MTKGPRPFKAGQLMAEDMEEARSIRIANLGRLCRIFASVRGYREQLDRAGMYGLAIALDYPLAELYRAIVRAGEEAGE